MTCPTLEYPKIRLPRELRTKYIRKVGDKLNLTIPFQVRHKPQTLVKLNGIIKKNNECNLMFGPFCNLGF